MELILTRLSMKIFPSGISQHTGPAGEAASPAAPAGGCVTAALRPLPERDSPSATGSYSCLCLGRHVKCHQHSAGFFCTPLFLSYCTDIDASSVFLYLPHFHSVKRGSHCFLMLVSLAGLQTAQYSGEMYRGNLMGHFINIQTRYLRMSYTV